MGSVTINQVYKAYGRVEIIKGISLAIADGEFVTLVGPSGCGKSTLLRMIAGLEEISAGNISINDVVVNDIPPKQRDIAMVFQNYALYPHMTVAGNMGFSMRLSKKNKAEIAKAVANAAGILDLSALLERFPRQLSGGQRQRVAMGRAIVRNPQVFLFDEPLSNLDAKLRVQMRSEIKQLHQRLGTTTVYVTHDQIEAMTLADRIVVLNKGSVEQVGKPMELYDSPANMFVANFIGSPSMNFIRGRVVNQKDESALVFKSGLRIPLERKDNLTDGDEVIFGVRPEHLQVHPKGFTCKVKLVEETGSETIVMVDLGEQHLTVVFRERIALRPGDEIKLAVQPGFSHFFSEKNGRRL